MKLRGTVLALSLLIAQAGALYGTLPRAMAQSAPTPKEEKVRIFSDKALYKREERKAQITGKVKVIQDNTTVFADELIYFEDTKQSLVEDGVRIIQINKKKEKGRVTQITSVKMTAFHDEKRFLFEEEVRVDRSAYTKDPLPEDFTEDEEEKRKRVEDALKKARSVITAERMEYDSQTENADLLGSVVVLQKEKKITSDKAFIRGPQEGDTITFEGSAEVIQINGNWLVQNKVIEPDTQDEEQQRMLREKLIINADKIILYQANDNLEAIGNVKITQLVGKKKRVATGDYAEYNDLKQTAVLSGNVRIQRENEDWMTAEKAIFYTDVENFEAIGTESEQVISEITLEDEDNPKPKEPMNPPLPEFNLDRHKPGPRLPSWLKKNAPKAPPATPEPTPEPTPTATPEPTPTPTPSPIRSSFEINTSD